MKLMNSLTGPAYSSNAFQAKLRAKILFSTPDLKLFDVFNEVSHSNLSFEALDSGRKAIFRVKFKVA